MAEEQLWRGDGEVLSAGKGVAFSLAERGGIQAVLRGPRPAMGGNGGRF